MTSPAKRRKSTAPRAARGSEKGLLRLLHFLIRGPARREPRAERPGEVLLVRPGARQAFPESLIAACLRRGLLAEERAGEGEGEVQQGAEREAGAGVLRALPEARALVRRLLSHQGLSGEAAAGEGAVPVSPFLAQHHQVEAGQVAYAPAGEGPARRVAVTMVRDDSPLAGLRRLRERDGSAYFPPEAIEAGERLARDMHFAGLQPRVTASWEPRLSTPPSGGRGGGGALSDAQADVRARLSRLLAALGPDLAGVVLDVCCFGKGLECVERERHWPARSAKLMLRTGLMALSRRAAPQGGRR